MDIASHFHVYMNVTVQSVNILLLIGYAHHGHTPPDNPRYMDACERHTWRRLERARQRLETLFQCTQRLASPIHPSPCTYSHAPLNIAPVLHRQPSMQQSCGANEQEQFVPIMTACKKRRNYKRNIKYFSRSTKRPKHIFRSSSSGVLS